jgi:monovalent cation:H+ antiporter-2, CPA2 family
VLERAQVTQAAGLAITLPDGMSTRLCLKRALEFAPDLDVIVQAEEDKDIELLYQLGAKEVVQPEFEASLEISAHLLLGMGLPDLVIRKQVEEIRTDHYLDFQAKRPAALVSRDLRRAAQEMNSKWYPLPEQSPALGLTLAQLDLRRLTGVTLMAILRQGGEELDYPDPQTQIQVGDRLLVVGQPEEIQALSALLAGQITLPIANATCQWVLLPSGSIAAAKTLGELELNTQYQVLVQAIRREGQLLRFPEVDTALQAEDFLLLCGSPDALAQVELVLSARSLSLTA